MAALVVEAPVAAAVVAAGDHIQSKFNSLITYFMATSSRSPLIKALQRAFATSLYSKKHGVPLGEAHEMVQQQFSRRKFITTTSTAAAITAISGSAFLEACTGKRAPVVAIVGGGIAGLYAAYILRNAGIIANIYEASGRTGGRIYTMKNLMGKGTHTELGGEFIDSTHADILRLADDFNLGLIDTQVESETSLKQSLFFIEGQPVDDATLLNMLAPFVPAIQQDVASLSADISYTTHTDADIALDNMSLQAYLQHIGITGPLYKLIDVAYTTEYGLDVAQQSAINFLMLIDTSMKDRFRYSGFSDERYKIAEGNQSITESLTDLLEGQISLGMELIAIGQKNEGDKVLLQFSETGGKHSTVEADYVILTLPFTILRNVDITYPITANKRRAIQELGYGQNAKFFMQFQKRVWREQGYTGFMFSDSIVQNAWDHTQLQPGETGGFTVFTGGAASKVMETTKMPDFAAMCMNVLSKAYPHISDPNPDMLTRFHWPTHPYTKASYTCFAPGQFTTIEGAQREPAGRLYFAGEHCSFEFQGFMNGAAQTGREAAEAVIKALKG